MLSFRSWSLARTSTLALVPGLCLGVAFAAPQDPQARSTEEAALAAQRRLYQDDALFEQLSSAAQRVLISRFGPRPTFDAKGNPATPPSMGYTSALPKPLSVVSSLGNVLVNDPTLDATAQDTQSETALVLGSGSNLVAAFNDSGQFLSVNKFTGKAYSSNGGATWTDGGGVPGTDDVGDPVLARDATTGRIYLTTLSFTFAILNCFRSDDDGVTWLPAVNCAPGVASGSLDKEWITVDNFPGAGGGNVYLVTRDFGSANGITFFSSTDQGSTFGPSGGTPIASGAGGNVQGAYVVVTPNHDVHAFWFDSSVTPFQIRTRRSSDFGATWSAPVTVTNLVSTNTNGNLTLVAGFRSNSFPQVAVNPASGHLYCTYNDPVAVSGGDRGNIQLRTSLDNGATWSAPITVNTDGTTRAQYFPAIAVKPDGTGLSLAWYDNRSDADDRLMERWGVTCSISGSTLTFGPNFRISPQFPPVFGVDPVVNSVYMGDYDQMAASNTAYYSTWADNRDNSLAVPSRKNANVRFTTYGDAGPGAILDFQSFALSGGNGNGKLDFNECNQVAVSVINNGSATATGITATLSSSTPGVSIFTPTQAMADLAPGASGSPLLPFSVATSPSYGCDNAVFTLTITHAAGTDVSSFTLAGNEEYAITVGSGTVDPSGADIGNHGDDVATSISLPFPVAYYGGSFTSASVNSNGTLQFTGASTAFANVCLPDALSNNAIFAHWDDLRTDGVGGGVFTTTVGTAPNREFHIEWRTIYFSGAGTANFEIRLYEGSSSFDIVYGTIGQSGASATIGCQEGTGVHTTTHSCNVTGTVPSGTKLTFALPACVDGGGQCGPPPVLGAVAPDHGPNSGGTFVLTGTDLTTTSAVLLDGVAVAFTVDSDTQVTATYGATSTRGFVDVALLTASGSDVLVDAFDLFLEPATLASACDVQSLTWSGVPTLGQNYTLTTTNLGAESQLLLLDWSNQAGGTPKFRRSPAGGCGILVVPDTIVNLGNTASHTLSIPSSLALVDVHLRAQARILATGATTEVVDATIGE